MKVERVTDVRLIDLNHIFVAIESTEPSDPTKMGAIIITIVTITIIVTISAPPRTGMPAARATQPRVITVPDHA